MPVQIRYFPDWIHRVLPDIGEILTGSAGKAKIMVTIGWLLTKGLRHAHPGCVGRKVEGAGKRIDLTSNEFALLEYLTTSQS